MLRRLENLLLMCGVRPHIYKNTCTNSISSQRDKCTRVIVKAAAAAAVVAGGNGNGASAAAATHNNNK